MFIITIGAIFIASFGIKVQDAFYMKTEIIVANYE
jgi:hypothetical protein